MKTELDFEINSSLANYKVSFPLLNDLNDLKIKADAILVDSFFINRLTFEEGIPVIWIEANEGAKTLQGTLDIFIALKEAGLGRNSHIYAIGGGVIQDIATFVASLYMRGIRWSYIPTTFLGMTDSCLGGKSSINVGSFKNLIGNFYPPFEIQIVPLLGRTLPPEELAGGLAEAAKICFCKSTKDFDSYEKKASPILNGLWDERQIQDLLYTTLSIKKWFIEIDEFDKSERRLLNFGHTWGHALESATGFKITHGLAVAIGMMASVLFVKNDYYAESLFIHCLNLLSPILQEEHLNRFNSKVFVKAFTSDKKHTKDFYHLIVPNALTREQRLGVREIKVPSNNKSLDLILQAIEEALNILRLEVASKASMMS